MPVESARGRRGKSMRCALFSAALLIMSCLGGEEGDLAYFRLEADPVLLTYSRVTVRLSDTLGRAGVTLYDDSLPSLARFFRLPAGAYRGETVLISIDAYRQGRLAYRETRIYDGLAGKALSVTVSAKIPTAVAVEDAPESVPEGRTAPALVFRQGDTLVSIRDSVTLEFEAADADGDLSGHAWNCGEGGNFRDSAFLSGRHAAIRIGLRFADPGTRLCSVRVWDGEGGSIRKEVRVRVELDPPWADAGTDTLVAAGSEILLHARGEDGFGPIVTREWNIGDGGFVAVPRQETAFRAPAEGGQLICVLRVMDSDSLFALDTMMVTVVPVTPP